MKIIIIIKICANNILDRIFMCVVIKYCQLLFEKFQYCSAGGI